MALKSNNTALAIGKQPLADTFTDPGSNYMPFSQCRFSIEGVTIQNDEYTGSPIRNADDVAGKRCTLTYNVKLRHPGGAVVPAANAYLPGLILQAAKFTELLTSTAIPVAPESVSAGTTTGMTLGAGAAGTADLYKGMAIEISDAGATRKARMSAIRSYTAGKVATLVEQLALAPAANYQIPKQVGYMRDTSSADPSLISQKLILDGHRYDLMNCRLSGLQIVVPTSTKEQAAYPEFQVSWTADIAANSEQPTPAVPPLGAVPFYKDGDGILALKRVGLSTFTVDLGLQTEYPPNPNKVDGVDAAELTGATASVQMTRQKYLPSFLDTLALADAQAQYSFFAQWGAAGGPLIQIVVTDGRFDYQNPDMGGNMIMEQGRLLIDAFSRGICINFVY